jgi:hypothetical protein
VTSTPASRVRSRASGGRVRRRDRPRRRRRGPDPAVGPVPGVDFSPYAFVVEPVVLFWALFGFDLLDLPPLGRATLFEQLSDPAFVLDATDRIVDNGAARAVIGDGIVGRRLATVAPAVAAAGSSVEDDAGPRGPVRLRDVTVQSNRTSSRVVVSPNSQSAWSTAYSLWPASM